MNEKVVVEVSGIRLEEDSETPIMLLQDPKTYRFLPIWIGTIEAVSIAYAQEGFVHPRPQTHDLLIDIVESLNATISEVCITDIQDKTYFAEITLNTLEGNVTLSSRPSDAIALAIRSNSKITVDNELFNKNSIILIEENNEQIQQFKDFIDGISPEDFS
ncbi:MAG: bifunctional nuclease family protein [Candidatus Actinomarina sp.]|jgi:bifunctional DNase/RNase|tara:strand:+ start:254 stop:733 length:480 start_codon:yes stop_codon:yes gene_type:complete